LIKEKSLVLANDDGNSDSDKTDKTSYVFKYVIEREHLSFFCLRLLVFYEVNGEVRGGVAVGRIYERILEVQVLVDNVEVAELSWRLVAYCIVVEYYCVLADGGNCKLAYVIQ
jgi:hypothetical protein